MIRALSPYYITIPWLSPATGDRSLSYTLNVYIWSGLKASVPATAEYSFTKYNSQALTSGSDTTVDIARIAADFINVAAVEGSGTSVNDANSTWWVQWDYTYVTTVGDEPTPQGETTKLFSRGYSYGNEGGNIETVTSRKLFDGNEFKADRNSYYSLPILIDESSSTEVSIVSYPSNEISQNFTVAASTDSSELAKVLWIDLNETTSDEYITVKVNLVVVATILIEDELEYTPVNIFFINKYGDQQSFTFFKERKDSLSVTSSEFEADRGQPSLGNHQFITYNVQGRSEFDAWTGFIDEENNETIKQLLFSERIWSYEGGNFIPLNIKTKSQSWKTQLNDSLINYNLGFELSYNEINNI